ncbi:MAG TPA: polysaccharide pyruvyl transferase family protein [Nannocystaceae bacterium]|nr:polysaccharide pyruvyl transferase family protein [Nannocystaceae bacterium]
MSKAPAKKTSLWQRLKDTVKDTVDPDRALMAATGSLIEAVAVKRALDVDQEKWAPGKPLKILFAGYVGTRNTGADVRVEEMIRQIRHCVGDDSLELTIMTVDEDLSAGYFRTVRQVVLPTLFPRFLFEECPRHHGVIACEGSMFKSKFASALSTMMAGSLGFAAAEDKLSVGYGAEAGAMTPALSDFVAKHCAKSLVLCRNEPSRKVLGDLGVRTTGGTDTAWTFDPSPLPRGAQLLRDAGWDGKTKVLALCPINPFWWPVKPDLVKTLAHTLGGQYNDEHYSSIYFHANSEKIDKKYDTYIQAFADATNAFLQEHKVFPILVGMEQLDRRACEALQPRLDVPAPLFVSDQHNMYDMVSVLRNCDFMVSSRFHAIVTSMPGRVASAGVTMDERIRNLMNDRGHPDLFLEVDEADLAEKILKILRRLWREQEQIADDIGRTIPKQLALMGQMGIDFMDEVVRVYPEFPRRPLPRTWEAHLPPLPPAVRDLMERFG